jgi:peptide/nickel transport system permease protein
MRPSPSVAYAAQKIAAFAVTLFAASAVIFLLLQVAPGDPAAYMMGLNADPAAIAALRAELGLGGPTFARYLNWLASVAVGDLGLSYTYRTPVASLILERLAVSAPLAALALMLTIAIGFPAGFVAAARRGQFADRAVTVAAQIGLATPNFWLAMLFIYLFSTVLGWAPSGGFPGWDKGLAAGMGALLLPALSLALPQAAILARVVRGALIDSMAQSFMLTARAKGRSMDAALAYHGVRHALIPAVTIIGMQFSFLVAGAVIIENVFFLPGLGRLIFQAVAQRDLIVVQGVALALVAVVVVSNLVADILCLSIDPRLRKV